MMSSTPFEQLLDCYAGAVKAGEFELAAVVRDAIVADLDRRERAYPRPTFGETTPLPGTSGPVAATATRLRERAEGR
jgi:hypothetical protein